MDNITKQSPATVVAEHERDISMIQTDREFVSLFVGDLSRKVVQYALSRGYSMLRVVKDYGKLGIGWIISSCQSGQFVVVGGNKSLVRVIDIREKKLKEGSLETAIRYIYSLKLCKLSETRLLLSVTGSSPNYSGFKSDLYNASGLICSSPSVAISGEKCQVTDKNIE